MVLEIWIHTRLEEASRQDAVGMVQSVPTPRRLREVRWDDTVLQSLFLEEDDQPAGEFIAIMCIMHVCTYTYLFTYQFASLIIAHKTTNTPAHTYTDTHTQTHTHTHTHNHMMVNPHFLKEMGSRTLYPHSSVNQSVSLQSISQSVLVACFWRHL